MSVIWHKVWADLWNNKVRTTLAVLSIAAGVFAVGATFGMVDQLLSGMDAAHQATVPSHINIFLQDDIGRDTAHRLRNIRGVEDLEVANQIGIRYKINPKDEWQSGVLVMRDDYSDQLYDTYELNEGDWPEKNRYGIERLSSQYYGIDMGDKVILEVDGREQELSISSRVRHPFVPPPQFGGPAFFFADAQGLERFGVKEGEFGNLKIRVTPYSEEFVREIASEIKDRLSKQGYGVAQTFYQDPEEHWGRPIMEGLNLVLQIMAVMSLGASLVLVLNTLTALITQQTDQIGIIKAIGGTAATIIEVYLVGVLVYGLLALLISLPLGMFAAYTATRWLLNFFNIDYDVFQYSSRAVVFQMMAAIAVPLLAALWPVLRGATITVREAIGSYGLGGDFGSTRVDRAVESIAQRLFSAPYAVALGNMFRRKGRLILTQLVLITAGVMFLAVMSMSSSISQTLDNEFHRRNYDLAIFFKDNERTDRVVAIAQSMPGVKQAQVWFDHSASILKQGQRTKEAGIAGELTGIPAGSDMFAPLIVAGRWLQPGDDKAVVILKDAADDHYIRVGDTVILDAGELGDDVWQVVGLYQSLLAGDIGGNDPIYANLEAVYRATKKHNIGSDLYVRTEFHSAAYADAMATQLKELFNTKNVKTNFSDTVYEFRDNLDAQFDIIVSMMLVLAIIVATVGGIGLTGSLSISVVERTKEIGVMRAIGARTPTILAMFMLEGIMQGLLSWALVVPISFVLGRPIADALGQAMFNANLDYRYNITAVFIWLIVMLTISTLASIFPARGAAALSVRDSLAYQ